MILSNPKKVRYDDFFQQRRGWKASVRKKFKLSQVLGFTKQQGVVERRRPG